MRATLAEEFVSAWVLARDLADLARAGGPELVRLCTLLRENYAYPVDSVLVTPDLAVVGHQNANDPAAFLPEEYHTFLARGLALARGEPLPQARPAPAPPPAAVRLTPDAPSASLLDLFQAGKPDAPTVRFLPLDVASFPPGATLELEARVGSAAAAGRFELCASFPDYPGFTSPVRTLERVAPGTSATATLELEAGCTYGLAIRAADGEAEGATNAFLAKLTVRPR